MQALKGLHSQLRLFELAGRALCAACMPGTLQTIQTRILSAVPAVEPSEEQEDSYNRRMREMLEAGVAARWAERNEQRQDVGTVHGQASKHQISEGNGGAGRAGLSSPSESARPRRRLDLTGIPMFSLDAARKPRVKSGGEAEPGPGSKARSVDNSPLDWRQLLQLVRLHQTTVTGEQMLTDSFRRKHTYLRISLTERCNLRCRYCMPAEGIDLTPSQELLSSDEVLRLARIFASAGVNKIRLTGGEPTVRRDIVDMCNAMSSLPGVETVGMTTNGVALLRKLGPLKEAGLNALNISLDTLRPERFEAMTRRRGHANVMRSIEKAVELGYSPLKVNVVVMKGVNDDEIVDFVELTRTLPLNVRFIEYMPFDGNVWSDTKLVTYKEMKRIVVDHLRRVQPDGSDEVLERMADPKGEVAKNFRLPGFKGTVSFVTSMTSNFCGDCNRLRLLADGNLKVCLFGANEVSLRDAMREGASDEELKTIISAALDRKRAAHAGMFELARTKNRAMITIGG